MGHVGDREILDRPAVLQPQIAFALELRRRLLLRLRRDGRRQQEDSGETEPDALHVHGFSSRRPKAAPGLNEGKPFETTKADVDGFL